MALNRSVINAWADDDGSNTVGELISRSDFLVGLCDPIDAEIARLDAAAALRPLLPGTSPPTTTGTQTALALPAGTGDLVIYANNASLLTVQGIAAGLAGQRLTIVSKGAGQVDFAHLHAAGTALGKLKLFATTGLTSLAAGIGVATFQYDLAATQWRLLEHEQGDWIAPAYSAGNFTAGGAMTWTVDAGDIGVYVYWLKGRTLFVGLSVSATSVGGTPADSLLVAIPGGFTALGTTRTVFTFSDAGGTRVAGTAFANSGGGLIFLRKFDSANWSAATNTTIVELSLFFKVS